MAPGVPFALLAGVQLLSVAAALGLAGAACFPRLRRRTSPIFVIGAVLLAVADTLTALDYGSGVSDSLAGLRCAALLLMAVGLATGVLRPPDYSFAQPTLMEPAAVGAVVAPLGATPGGAVAVAVSALLAALASLRGRRVDATGAWLLSGAFTSLAVSAALMPAARTSWAAAVAVLSMRGVWALLVFAFIVRLARASVLAKVVVAILGGVLAMSIGAVAVGSVVAGVVSSQQREQAQAIARAQSENLDTVAASAGTFAKIVAAACNPQKPDGCSTLLSTFGALDDDFAATVRQNGKVKLYTPSTQSKPVSVAGGLQLKSEPVVRAVLEGQPATVGGVSTLAVIDGDLVALGVYPVNAPGQAPNTPPEGGAAVYAGRIADKYATRQSRATTYDVTVLVDGTARASSLSDKGARVVADEGRRTGATSGALIDEPQAVLVRTAVGDRPTVAYQQLFSTGDRKPVAVLAVSQDAATALSAQRRAFTQLFLVALGVMLATSIVALLIGRRIVDPVRQLTVVASRVRKGDLTATSDVTSQDEVGTLARAFNAMTASVASLTGDLRAAAAEEAALRARLETVLASMSDGVVATDAERMITSINRTAATIVGIEPEAAVGRPVAEVFAVIGGDGEPIDITSATRTPVEGVVRRGEGQTIPVLVDAAPLQGAEDGDGAGFVVVVRDQTRDREVERMKTEFLSNVSHELRTPLTPIRGYAELLRRRPDLPRQQTESYVDTILDSSIRMTRVVDLLVDVAAIEAGRVRAEVRSVAVGSFVDQRLEIWRTRYPERAGDLKRRVSRGLPQMSIDPEWVGKALDEFADNAMKYTPPGAAVVLVAAPGAEGRVQLSVRDAGPGIEPEAMSELFGDFIQADGSETRRVGGLGLGLSFVRRLAEALDLGVEVRSDQGKGSEFVLDVPSAVVSDVAPRRRTPRPARAAARRPAAKRPSSARRRRPPVDPPEAT